MLGALLVERQAKHCANNKTDTDFNIIYRHFYKKPIASISLTCQLESVFDDFASILCGVCVCVCVHIFRCFFFAQSPIFLLSFFPVLTSAHSRSLLTDKQTKEYCCCRIDIKVTIHSKTEIEKSTKKKQYWNVLWLRLNCICVYCVDVFTNSFQ